MTELYRAMCLEELQATLAAGRPVFIRRFKWFSPDLSFVRNRVMDGSFNNSRFKRNRYAGLVRFTVGDRDTEAFRKMARELMLDRRVAHLVAWVKVEALK